MIAIIGTDGTRNVVWGVGRTRPEALRDAAQWTTDAPSTLRTERITAEQAAVVRAGDVSWPVRTSKQAPSETYAARKSRGRAPMAIVLGPEDRELLVALASARGETYGAVVGAALRLLHAAG